jgi:hypothetical protein
MKKVYIYIVLFCLFTTALAQDKPYRVLNSFSAGQLSELLSIREDLSKYHSGCSIMKNFFPLPQGGAQKRPGTVYVAESKENTKIRLLPFEYSTEQSYASELGNQYVRFYTDNAQITGSNGENTTSYPQYSSLKSHWKLNEVIEITAVDDDGDHDGTINVDASFLTSTGQVGQAFDFDNQYEVSVSDHADFTFQLTAFTISCWIYVDDTDAADDFIISKHNTGATTREYWCILDSSEKLKILLYDETADKDCSRITNAALSTGWRYVVITYDGGGGATAANGLTFYVNGSVAASTATNDASFVKMRDTAANVYIGAYYNSTQHFDNQIDNIAIWKGKELTSSEVSTLYALQTGTDAYEILTPYLTTDLFELKYEQSADVLYITHPDYEPRKLSRYSNTSWSLEAIAIENGPFRNQNTIISATISADGTTGSVTLTATNCSPFVDGTTAGHEPSGALATSKSQTGALFKLVHPLATLEYSDELDDNYTNSQVENVSWMDCGTVYEGATWYLTTLGTWTGTLEIQRNYTVGAAHDAAGWETADIRPFASVDDRNVITSGTEDWDAASYRAILTESGDTAEECKVYFSTDQTEHIGIVEITAVASTTSATATVLTTLASTDATHKWSEGSWSNYRGWPRTVAFFEDRLTFGGNSSQPDTIWASVTADYENMKAGADDNDALLYTLSSRQVNIINWMIGKNKILIGTSGAEWTLAGSGGEPLSASVVPKAEQHSTYGSANLQATQASESILFFQRGSEKMRELAYDWESDSYVAPDMTILVPEITGDGITDTAFQQTPNPILWCVKENGEIATFVYERHELLTSWSTQITDGDFESVAVISGSAEDQVWVSVARVIGGNTQRYIEYFSARDFGTDVDDAFYVDCGITYDSTATTTITGLGHLEAEIVGVLGDGAIQTSQLVAGSQITITEASTVQAGLLYETQLRTMPLSWVAQGVTIQGRIKKINEVIARYYNSGNFKVGRSATVGETINIDGMNTEEHRITFPAGYDRPGYVYIYQQSVEPLTLLGLMIEFQIY